MAKESDIRVAKRKRYRCQVPDTVESTEEAKANRRGDLYGTFVLPRSDRSRINKEASLKQLKYGIK